MTIETTTTKAEIGNDQIQLRAGINPRRPGCGRQTLTINNGGVNSTVQLTLKADGHPAGKTMARATAIRMAPSAGPNDPSQRQVVDVTATQTDQGRQRLPAGQRQRADPE